MRKRRGKVQQHQAPTSTTANHKELATMATKNDSSNPKPSKIDLASEIRDAIGSHLAQIAQGARLIQGDAEARMYEPRSAIELAAELEEVRERCAIAYALIEQALERINEAHGTASYTASPLERAQAAMRGAA